MVFANRRRAGVALAARILSLDAEGDGLLGRHGRESPSAHGAPVVLALPRGGVPVGFEIAIALQAPLDVLLARKIGAPGNPELGIGAVAEDGTIVLSEEALRSLQVSAEQLEHSTAIAQDQLRERARLYRAGRAPVPLAGRTAIVVDDGLATGGTARAAVRAARTKGAGKVVLAAPVGARSTVSALRGDADEVVCLLEPEPMWAIGVWYRNFRQVSDEEVLSLLACARERSDADAAASDSPS